MKALDLQVAVGAVIFMLAMPAKAKGPGGLEPLDVLHKRHLHANHHPDHHLDHHHHHHHRAATSPRATGLATVEKRGQCQFPADAGLIAVTPDQKNGGWAMSPDQCCEPGTYCPYACPPGQIMAQWNPHATSYTFPESMDGGLFCDNSGQVTKPFPNEPYCVDGTGAMGARNHFDEVVAFCQTVLPGNEAMLIPTAVMEYEILAVPGTNYWCETAAHYYINPPGIPCEKACVWGSGDEPIGNWSPYVSGANTDAAGLTYVKIGWNPIYTGCELSKTLPTFGIRVECHGSCVGLPCEIDPSVVGLNGVSSPNSASGAGGADFCVVTAQKGSTANIVVFEAGNPNGSSGPSGPAQGTQAGSSSQAPASLLASPSSSTIASTTSASTALTTGGGSSTNVSTISTLPVASSGIVFQNSTHSSVSTTGGSQETYTASTASRKPTATAGAVASISWTSASMCLFTIPFFGAALLF